MESWEALVGELADPAVRPAVAAALRELYSTAARRLVAARQEVFDATHRFLRAELAIDTSEFASLARALHDQLNVSLGGLLADPGP